jgi:uncharacterized protein YqjF (DUF2071 family)
MAPVAVAATSPSTTPTSVPWLQVQAWRDVLFAHRAVPAGALRPAAPPELPIDEFDGRAWIAVTPFEVMGLRLRGTPALPDEPPPLHEPPLLHRAAHQDVHVGPPHRLRR